MTQKYEDEERDGQESKEDKNGRASGGRHGNG